MDQAGNGCNAGRWQLVRRPFFRVLALLLSLGFAYLVASLAWTTWCRVEGTCGDNLEIDNAR